ncbi:NAD(P)/FAD-dependent oxidoreductase [Microbacterium sp. 77mftsu3.1]|uniref:NAD(P)/FAD-dependent oxidoreductase n=1 Tax=Microbacterium sp. 77mftsu3.1 TaxID=1761802 RepID=UPI00036F34F3|nr:FAD-dependent oxidoreductase [Microbacterium sp. 77mftsu3.1]SDH33205.1 thioredoxin reductase (NADPH) [Microbacterium sp. 77mftsu3.1]
MSSSHALVIIGGGPAALTAAIYAARAGHTPVVYVGTAQPGGDLTTTTEVDNFPGFPEGIQGPELIENMMAQAARFGAVLEFADVTAIDVEGQAITVDGVYEVSYDAVIVTTGSEHRKLGLAQEAELTGSGVSYCATCDGVFFKDENVAVVGGGDSAMEEAIFLAKHAAKVTVLVRGATLRASKAMAARAEQTPNIEILYSVVPIELVAPAGRLEAVRFESAEHDHPEWLDVTGLFVAIGSDPRTDLIRGQVSLTEHGTIATLGRSARVPSDQHRTPGFFAAGDVIDHSYRQAITAAGSGAVAGIEAAEYLDELSEASR